MQFSIAIKKFVVLWINSYPIMATTSKVLRVLLALTIIQTVQASEDRYLRYVKDSCFLRGEALSCLKYKALKIVTRTIFGNSHLNETIKANQMISFVPLDDETIAKLSIKEKVDVSDKPRSFLSEWTEIAKYFMKHIQEFFKMNALKVNLPEGARTIEDEEVDENARGKKKKLAILIPLLTLLATIKTKFLLVPIFLAVMLIKKLLLAAALFVPSLLSTLKACKHQHPMTHYSYFGNSDSTDYNSDYGNTYSYSSGGGYGKDWASNRAYALSKPRPTPAPVYITAPGSIA